MWTIFKNKIKIRSVILREAADRQTDKRTNGQADKQTNAR